MTDEEKAATVATVSAEALAVKAHEKLSRKSLDVDIIRNLSLYEEIAKMVEAVKKSPESNTEAITQAEQQLESLKKDTISATLVPLRAMDILLVQGWVTEAAIQGKAMGFDFDVQLFVMSKAERAATAYLALRKRSNPAERYFATQDEVALLDDRTLREIAKLYSESFVLTEEERKNS